MRRLQSAAPRYSKRGWILPAKAYGHNLAGGTLCFQYRDDRTAKINSIPPGAIIHKTYSLYTYNATIWTIDYDATAKQVHNGEDTSESGEQTPENRERETFSDDSEDSEMNVDSGFEDDWVSMSFGHLENLVSYAGRRREHWRLCVERNDQDWARLMLPDAYTAQASTENGDHGGLVGDLPLLIGLVALSVPEEQVEEMLAKVMRNPWQFSLEDPLRRRDGSESRLCLKHISSS